MRITLLLLFLSFINAQIALPTFHAVHKPHTTVAESGSQTFSYTGAQQTFTVPSGVTSIEIKAYGAAGGSYPGNGNDGGLGGYAIGTLSVTAGNTLYIYVGGEGVYSSSQNNSGTSGGWNGGGRGGAKYGSSGGGASDVRSGGTALSNRVIVAGAGGGFDSGGGDGGAGGGTTGGSGGSNSGTPPTGGTQSAGGTGGSQGSYIGENGTLGDGGDNSVYSGNTYKHGGGGGGGYYGGGGGTPWSSGAGGSGYIGGVTNSPETIAGNATMPDPDGGTMTGREGNGLVVISW